jgi:hypothetical protein
VAAKQRVGELLGVILNVAFVFAAVSYAASSLADMVSGIVGWRAKLLLGNVKDLVDDPQFEGLALTLYNNINFNPVSLGNVHSEAELSECEEPAAGGQFEYLRTRHDPGPWSKYPPATPGL